MLFSSTTHILIPSLPPSDTNAHGVNHLASGSLFSVRQTCDQNFTAVFNKHSVIIFKSIEFSINAFLSIQNPRSPQFTITTSLFSDTAKLSTINPQSKYNHQCLINLRPHLFLFSPTISTCYKSIKKGFLQSWPELTVNQVTKYTPISEATVKVHMHAQ